jgi:hypothetical protein
MTVSLNVLFCLRTSSLVRMLTAYNHGTASTLSRNGVLDSKNVVGTFSMFNIYNGVQTTASGRK